MARKPIKLSDDEINEHVIRISKSSVKFVNKQILKSLEMISYDHKKELIDPVDFINMIICATSSININILRKIKHFHFSSIGKELNYKGLVDAFNVNLQEFLKMDLAEYYKEKLN